MVLRLTDLGIWSTYLNSPGDLVHVLWLDDGLEVILQDLGEVVLQFRAAEVDQDLLPIWRFLQRYVVCIKRIKWRRNTR